MALDKRTGVLAPSLLFNDIRGQRKAGSWVQGTGEKWILPDYR